MTWKHESVLRSINRFSQFWWFSDVDDIFLARPLITVEHCLNTRVYPSSVGCFHKKHNAPYHKAQINRLVSCTWQWLHCTQTASRVTRFQSKSATTLWFYQISMSNASIILLNLCHEVWSQFWRQKVFKPGSSKMYLVKCLVSVYMTQCIRG